MGRGSGEIGKGRGIFYLLFDYYFIAVWDKYGREEKGLGRREVLVCLT